MSFEFIQNNNDYSDDENDINEENENSEDIKQIIPEKQPNIEQ